MKGVNGFLLFKNRRPIVMTTRAAWTEVNAVREGTYVLVAEGTAVYWLPGTEVPTGTANEGNFLPRDEMIPIYIGSEDKFYYYLPDGGTARLMEVEIVYPEGLPKETAHFKRR